jgi:hypothetical protein
MLYYLPRALREWEERDLDSGLEEHKRAGDFWEKQESDSEPP